MKNILITGANSFIGESVRDYLTAFPDQYNVRIKDTIGWEPNVADFKDTDCVFNVAGIVHIKETPENRRLYYEVNRDLVIKIAKAAKEAGVKQFILLSSMSVYGRVVGQIAKETPTHPVNAYSKSKAEADEAIEKLADADFKFACLRPPMVYGKGCKGNYQRLRKFALVSPLFPNYQNQRSMIYIDNLCEFVKERIDKADGGLFFPQNSEYTNTAEMIRQIAEVHGKKIRLIKLFNWAVRIVPVQTVKKVFGDLIYIDEQDRVGKYNLKDSIIKSES